MGFVKSPGCRRDSDFGGGEVSNSVDGGLGGGTRILSMVGGSLAWWRGFTAVGSWGCGGFFSGGFSPLPSKVVGGFFFLLLFFFWFFSFVFSFISLFLSNLFFPVRYSSFFSAKNFLLLMKVCNYIWFFYFHKHKFQ